MVKRALITGITGQDGSYLAELLLSKNYEVHGLIRRSSNYDLKNINLIKDKLCLHYGDLTTDNRLCYLIQDIQPHEVYNLAGQSDVKVSFEDPEYTGEATGLGVLRILEALHHFAPNARFYQASSSEMFGDALPPQNENSPMSANSPYGAAKLYGFNVAKVYRRSYGIFACNGILFNHESERRGLNFVTRKITHAVANIKAGRQDKLYLGNLEARRDWGYAPDYVRAMWLMLQAKSPDDYVIGTGETHTVRDFCSAAFEEVNLDYRDHVVIDQQYFRPLEVNYLCADSSKARDILHWQPETPFLQLVGKMMEYDLAQIGMAAEVKN